MGEHHGKPARSAYPAGGERFGADRGPAGREVVHPRWPRRGDGAGRALAQGAHVVVDGAAAGITGREEPIAQCSTPEGVECSTNDVRRIGALSMEGSAEVS